jgi:methylmalonyl-CoA/ethylmalonyl-CoA epimerase
MSFRLHHTGVVVPELAPALEQYVARYGYEVCTGAIHDPTQRAYVQFLRLPGDRVYLELVAPDGPASRLSQAAEKGGGLHHLCYAAADLPSACRELRERGMTLVRKAVPAVAFPGRSIAWLMGRDRVLVELLEESSGTEL